jgi:L-aspartate semialdehyde sulfurtransferase
MSIHRTYDEINQKISEGKAIIMTAEEVALLATELTPSEIAKKVDVVTTGTFGAMCSSGVFINFGHSEPPIKMKRVYLNNVPAYGGLAAVDAYLGATELSEADEKYGGAHVIEDLIKGKNIHLRAFATGTDCYPRKDIETIINKNNVNEIIMFNPRNAYQNYNVAVNSTAKIKYTYMGNLLPRYGNATYSTSGELSPLLNDPELRTIGIGTRIFLGGTEGFVSWNGTQFNTSKPKNEFGIPMSNAATIATIGDLKKMSTEFIRAAYFEKYGVSLFVGIGIPIPVLDVDMAHFVSVNNERIETSILDYGVHPSASLGLVNYKQLQSGEIMLNGKKVRTAPLSSIVKARQIAQLLKTWISEKKFYLSEPVQLFPSNSSVRKLEVRM